MQKASYATRVAKMHLGGKWGKDGGWEVGKQKEKQTKTHNKYLNIYLSTAAAKLSTEHLRLSQASYSDSDKSFISIPLA